MKATLSPALTDAIRRHLDEVEYGHGILDAYKAAQGIQRAYPDEIVTIDEIIAAMMACIRGIRAIEFDPQTA